MDNIPTLFSSLSPNHNTDRANLASSHSQQNQHQSILINLKNILNSRKGSIRHLPDFGISDISNIYSNMPESLHTLVADISFLIKKYEPRLQNIFINILEINLDCIVCLEILAEDKFKTPIQLLAKFYPDGKTIIK